jgi:hypothetical protein
MSLETDVVAYAHKNLGKKCIWHGAYHETACEVIGYYGEYIIVSADNQPISEYRRSGYRANPYFHLLKDFNNEIYCVAITIITLIEPNDNCLDCGAIGDEECKEGCPNK